MEGDWLVLSASCDAKLHTSYGAHSCSDTFFHRLTSAALSGSHCWMTPTPPRLLCRAWSFSRLRPARMMDEVCSLRRAAREEPMPPDAPKMT